MLNYKDLWKRSLAVVPSGVHSPVRSFASVGGEPIFFSKAKGPYLWDIKGNKYIDFCLAFGPLILGHCDPEISHVIKETAENADCFGACEPYSLALAEFINRELPFLEKIRFVSSGTEAVMSTLRLARAATKREYVLKFEGCYHGHVDSLLVRAGSIPDSAGVTKIQSQNTFVLSLDDENSLEEFFQKNGKKLALAIIEPLPANNGLVVQRHSFLQKLADLCKQYGALLCFDEVISGFRVARQGMAGLTGIQADFTCLGKIIGGGFPVGAYCGRQELMDLLAPEGPVYQAGTLSANPFGMRAGLATLEKCKRDAIYEPLAELTKDFCQTLNTLLNTYTNLNWDLISFASLFWLKNKTPETIRSISAIPKEHQQNYAKIFHLFLDAGIYLPPSGFEVCFLSLAHTAEVLDEALEKIKKKLRNQSII